MRSVVLAVLLAALALPVDITAASAQEPGRVYRLGWLTVGSPGTVPTPAETWKGPWGAFRDSLQNAGFVLGKNLIVEHRHADGDQARLPAEVESLVATNVDMIVTQGTPPTVAAIKASKPVPVVFFGVGDPVEKGMIASLARPGGNASGTTVLITYPKLWQYLHEISPATRRVAVLSNAQNRKSLVEREPAYAAFFDKQMTDAATAAGLESLRVPLNTLDEVGSKLAEFASGGKAAVFISVDRIMYNWQPAIMKTALENGLASACPQDRSWAEAGCLVTYTEDSFALLRGAAAIAVKVLRGAKPGDIPVEQPTSGFKFIINARTARALAITVPPALLTAADEVID
ncbi:ABC transporter substrate-binding protein [Reyranella sp.]|jgi:putative ABC transport system substrate-binding protein|uniref:ABC transporter substrate-binding protein n=1 Tax=Reyranella sp. TaxID=1929291 RepID=UPI002F941E20